MLFLSLLPQADKDSASMAASPVQAIRLLFRIFIKPPLLRVILSFFISLTLNIHFKEKGEKSQ